jgi:hypothetical protein
MESHSRVIEIHIYIYIMRCPTCSVVILKDIEMVIAYGILQSNI